MRKTFFKDKCLGDEAFCDCFQTGHKPFCEYSNPAAEETRFVLVPFRLPHFQQLGSLQGMKNLCRQTLIGAIFYSAL
uniref:Uncharacterized protein n=1 Tax=Anguilla anguilla TaxID=7936 RepID=A0A0E9Q4I4_ANGAN